MEVAVEVLEGDRKREIAALSGCQLGRVTTRDGAPSAWLDFYDLQFRVSGVFNNESVVYLFADPDIPEVEGTFIHNLGDGPWPGWRMGGWRRGSHGRGRGLGWL